MDEHDPSGSDRKRQDLQRIGRLAKNGKVPSDSEMTDMLRAIVYLHKAGSFSEPEGWKSPDELLRDLELTPKRLEKVLALFERLNVIEYALMNTQGSLLRLASSWYVTVANAGIHEDALKLLDKVGEDIEAIEKKASRFSSLITSVSQDDSGRYVMDLGTQIDPKREYIVRVLKANGEIVEIPIRPGELTREDES